MRSWKLWFSLMALAAFFAIFIGIIGCESSSSTDTGVDAYFANNPYVTDPRDDANAILPLTPQSADITVVGQTILFSASQGDGNYVWALSNPSVGTITAASGNSAQATYIATALSPNDVIVHDGSGHSAIGKITANEVASLQIQPGASTFTASETNGIPPVSLYGITVQFRVIGGVQPYGSWGASSPGLGSINANGLYTGNGAATLTGVGVNTISITDNAGHVATATVTTQYHP